MSIVCSGITSPDLFKAANYILQLPCPKFSSSETNKKETKKVLKYTGGQQKDANKHGRNEGIKLSHTANAVV